MPLKRSEKKIILDLCGGTAYLKRRLKNIETYSLKSEGEVEKHVNPNCKDSTKCNPHSERGPVK